MKYLHETPFNTASSLCNEFSTRDHNEADTRFKIIDVVLNEILSIPRNAIACEEYIRPGYADYIISDRSKDQILIIEAKKDGIFFEVAKTRALADYSTYISIAELMTNDSISSAMIQVQTYALSKGIEFACITNGHEWIFFKVFERKKDWKTLQAFVITKINYFSEQYTECQNKLNYKVICDDNSLHKLLSTQYPENREVYFSKNNIIEYDYEVRSNYLAPQIRPLINRYFGVMGLDDIDFIKECYIAERGYINVVNSLDYVFSDTISPFLEQYGVKQEVLDSKGGKLGARLNSNLHSQRGHDLIILFGGTGAGKSTFIKKVLFVDPPAHILKYAELCFIDLLKVPEDKAKIESHILNEIVSQLDKNNILQSERQLLLSLFDDKYQIAKNQELNGLSELSEVYNITLNKLISEWKKDLKYCAKRLVGEIKKGIKSPVIIIDNTDQYRDLQDYCFTISFELSIELNCTVIITMREERFYESRIKGLLDAHQTEALHIRSPNPKEVYCKRFDYVIALLNNKKSWQQKFPQFSEEVIPQLLSLFRILRNEFEKEESNLARFLNACTHGNTRFSLELFRSFIASGYLNLREILPISSYTFLLHQILRPMMIPDRYYYDEEKSSVPNIIRLRSKVKSSHFTSLRILHFLKSRTSNGEYSYVNITSLKSLFNEKLKLKDDFEKNIDALLRFSLVEAENNLDHFHSSVSQLRITSYGLYLYNEILPSFAYLDLVCTDTGVYSQEFNNFLIQTANEELILLQDSKKKERVSLRLEKVDDFLKYLSAEEYRENELYPDIAELGNYTGFLLEEYEKDKQRVSVSLDKTMNRIKSENA